MNWSVGSPSPYNPFCSSQGVPGASMIPQMAMAEQLAKMYFPQTVSPFMQSFYFSPISDVSGLQSQL